MVYPNHFNLAFYHESKREYVLASEYLEQHLNAASDWVPNIEYTGLSLIIDGKEWVLERRSVGRYPDLIPQLDAIVTRLQDGKNALLRTAVEDTAEGTYFLFEPTSESVLISLIYIYDEKVSMHYPSPNPGQNSEELYSYVAVNKEYLFSSEAAFGYRFNRLSFPKTQLIDKIEVEAMIGREILSLAHFATRD